MLLPIWVEAALLFLAFCVVAPAIASVIGYAAWRGRPKNWDRSMYGTVFAILIMSSGFLMGYAGRMQADVRTWQYLAQITVFGLGVILFGVAGGCLVAIFTYGRGKGPVWRGVAANPEHSTDRADNTPDHADRPHYSR